MASVITASAFSQAGNASGVCSPMLRTHYRLRFRTLFFELPENLCELTDTTYGEWLAAIQQGLIIRHPGLSLGKFFGSRAGRSNMRNGHVVYLAEDANDFRAIQ
jgi:hypothetical protein